MVYICTIFYLQACFSSLFADFPKIYSYLLITILSFDQHFAAITVYRFAHKSLHRHATFCRCALYVGSVSHRHIKHKDIMVLSLPLTGAALCVRCRHLCILPSLVVCSYGKIISVYYCTLLQTCSIIRIYLIDIKKDRRLKRLPFFFDVLPYALHERDITQRHALHGAL